MMERMHMMTRSNIVVVVCPYPAMGHIKPMMQLARQFFLPTSQTSSIPSRHYNNKGVCVKFVCTEFYCERIRETWLATELEGIDVLAIPDGLPHDFDRSVPSIQASDAIANLGPVFESVLSRLHTEHDPSTTWLLIYDGFVPWAHDAAAKLLIPRVFFWTQSAAVLAIFLNMECLRASGFDPFPVEGHNPTTTRTIDFIPGLPPMPSTAFPFYVQKSADGKDRGLLLYQNLTKQLHQWKHVSGALIHSMDGLKSESDSALRALAAMKEISDGRASIPISTIGPLLHTSSPPTSHNNPTTTNESGDISVGQLFEWLDTRATASVLYISMGSVVRWEAGQAREVAMALLALRQAFVWVMRPWELRESLPKAVLDHELGRLVKWAPQVPLLQHPSIGAFFTHAGWNSTLETVSHGVPTLAWAHFVDQLTNAWFLTHHWQVGLEISTHDFHQSEIQRLISLLMHDGPDRRLYMSHLACHRDTARQAMLSSSSRKKLYAFLDEILDNFLSVETMRN